MTDQLPPICVIGAGTMGRGIAQVAVAAGHAVTLVDPDAGQLDAAETDMISRLVRKHPDAERMVKSQLRTATSVLDSPQHRNTVVIEAVVEKLEVKHSVFAEALDHFGPDSVLATNTSSLSVTEIAAGSAAPSRVVGMHFFNPVPVMKLVEVISAVQTDPEVAQIITDLATAWGKDVVHVRSSPGFIVNRVARPFYGEALKLLEEQVTEPENLDEVLRSAGQFRMGPFELIDLIGSDVNFAVTKTVWAAYNYDSRFAPSLIQREMVAAGRLGRKTGHGFYRYDGTASRGPAEPLSSEAACPREVILHGDSAPLAELLRRAGVDDPAREPAPVPALEIPGLGVMMVTRGKTALAESALRECPVLVLDRCLDPTSATALAFASTDPSLSSSAVALLAKAGIRSFPVADTPGLIVARIVSMLVNEAAETALHGVATPEDIDTAMELGTSYPLGPFAWGARWSPAAVVEILDNLWTEYHDPRYRTSVRLRAEARSAPR